MPRNEFTPPEFDTSLKFNREMFNGKLCACTNSIFCAGASLEAIHNIAAKAGITQNEAQAQALPTTGTTRNPVNLGNFNLLGTGNAYRQLIKENILEIKNGHADTVRTF